MTKTYFIILTLSLAGLLCVGCARKGEKAEPCRETLLESLGILKEVENGNNCDNLW